MLKTLNRKIIGDWKAHWKRFFAAWIVVTMGVAFYGAFYPAGKSLLTSIFATYDQLAYMDFQVSVERAPAEIVKKIRAIKRVTAAEGRIVRTAKARRGLHCRSRAPAARLGLPTQLM